MHTVGEIVADPNWFLQAINLDEERLYFIKTDKTALSAASFLDARFDTRNLESTSFGLQELLRYTMKLEAAPPRFVFHTAFCCSTLLARCLDVKDCNVSLKEPAVLMALANYQRVGHKLLANAADAHAIYRLVTLLLFRPFADYQTVVVKPTNTVNNIIGPLLSTHHASKAVLLHSDLKSFLLSILKKGEQGRGFARQLFNIFLMDSAEAQLLQTSKLLRMTDLQIAAVTWHLQFEHFLTVQQKFNAQSVRSLHCDVLLNYSQDTLTKLVSHFGMSKLEQNIEQMMMYAPLQRNAKTLNETYTAYDRKNEYVEAERRYAESLQAIIPWAKQLRFKYEYSEKVGYEL